MVTLNRNDLSHILAQIKIAEEHTRLIDEGMDPGEALSQLVTSPLLPFGLRTVDGSYNNYLPGMERFGAADEAMARLLTPVYQPAETNLRTGAPTSYEQTSGSVYDSVPRTVSNLVADQTLNNPAAIAAALAAVGVTGAEQLQLVQSIVDAHRQAQSLRAAADAAGPGDPAAVTAAEAALAAAQSAVDSAVAALLQRLAEQADADTALADAQAALDAATAALLAEDPGAGAVADAQAAVDAAQAALDAAIADAAAAQGALDTALANLAAKEVALEAAVAARDAAQALVDALAVQAADAAAELDAAQAALDALPASADVQAAEAAVTVATTNLADAEAQAALATAALDDADAALALATAEVDAATLAVATAQSDKDAADAAAAAAQATLDAEVVELAAAVAASGSAFATLQAAMDSGDFSAILAATTAFQNALDAQAAAQGDYDAALAADTAADTAALAAADTLVAAEAELAARQTALADAQAAQASAAAAHADALADVAAAEAVLALAEQALADAIAADTAVNTATAARDAAAEVLAAVQATAAVAADLLADQEAAVLAAEAERDVAAQAVADAEAVLAGETADLAAAEAALASVEAALAGASGLEDALAAVAAATADVASAQAVADAAALAVADAEAVQDAANADLASAQDALAAALAPVEADAAADAAEATLAAMLADNGIELEGETVFIRNIAADLGDTASFNGFMTIFGQFFDHGLDLTTKGGTGNVIIPLHPDDPLYVPGSPTNFMVLTRATNDPGPDGLIGTADDIRDHTNETTPWVDLNQVYTSNPSHQVFLREYVMVDGRPVATGKMLEGEAGGPPTWADIKAQARDMLGIELHDLNVHSVPLLVTDLYGEFVRGANGLPMLMTAGGPVEGDLVQPVAALDGLSAGRAFLNDIAHTAVPSGPVDHDRDPSTAPVEVTADSDTVAGNPIVPNAFGIATEYDDELLDAHYIVGDGRGNENIALTAVHTMFHGEHNRQIDAIKASLLAPGEGGQVDIDFLNQWLLVPVTEVPADPASLLWDGERLFQAGRFSTEMVYQHLVFEEFVRAIAPQIDPFVFSHSVEIDGAIFEEFAQVVYRFGHSMLAEDVEMLHLVGGGASPEQVGLIEAFLNPIAFDAAGVDAHAAAGAILRGMTRQAGNEIDEFLTEALRNNLVGLPLDLAALNMARARETGIPSLNEARRQFYEATNDTYLKPYDGWADFAAHLKNPLSVVNFIAAYGTHASIVSAGTAAEKRDAAWALVFGAEGETEAERAERLDFLNGTGDWAGEETGLNLVDFWIGGLAEELMTFGGMLGSTFTFVFEMQIENLQNADRLYYLSRTQGMNLLTQLESDSFADLVRRNTDTEDTGLSINGAAFQTADYIIEMDQARQWNEGLGTADPTRPADVLTSITGSESLVRREDLDGDGDIDAITYLGGEHIVIGGTAENDVIVAGDGDDTVWGEAGDDRIEGGFGVDHLHGGDGNDIITDSGTDVGEADVIKGEGGDDVINGGMGLDLIFGGSGSDVISGGSEAKDIFGGEGNDFIRAPSGGGGVIFGNEGDDWMEGQGNMTTLSGDNSELFFNSAVIGHDVMWSGENDTDFDAESGDDIMVQGIGINRNNGMAGFDWTTYQGNTFGADANMNIGIFVNQQNNILRDRYDLVEGLSGWMHDDTLTGREVPRGAADENGNAAQVSPEAPIESFSNVLLEKNLGLIDGLAELVAHLDRFDVTHPLGTTDEVLTGVMDTSDGSDILLGGGGSDTIRGMAGNDIIDGDKWLSVRLSVNAPDGSPMGTASGLTGQVFGLDGTLLFGGRTLESLLFSRDVTPSQLGIVREILDGGQEGDIDVAVYWDIRENYEITYNDDGSVTVTHLEASDAQIDPTTGRTLELEGTDRLTNIEVLRFADGEVLVADLAPTDAPTTGAPVILDTSPTETQPVSVDLAAIADPDGIAAIAVQWQSSTDNGATWTDIPGATGTTFVPPAAAPGAQPVLRVAATVTDANGIMTTVVSAPTDVVGDVINGGFGADTLIGGAGGDQIAGSFGNDTIDAGASDDVITWNWLEGRDTVNGGTESVAGDTFVVNGSPFADTFRVYALDAWQGLGGDRTVPAGTEIVITLGGTGNTNVIAYLQEIEEITINTGSGGFFGDNDQVLIFGDFAPTSLNFNTITINGEEGDDVVDITGLSSAHRILFRTGGGNDVVVGALRAQDVIVAPDWIDPASYVASQNPATGMVTLAALGSTISFFGSLEDMPQIVHAEDVPTEVEEGTAPVDLYPAVADRMFGTAGHDHFQGGSGDDLLVGRRGHDTLEGGDHADILRGGKGRDHLDGGDGDDTLIGGRGRDMLKAGDGNDTLHDGKGADLMFGEDGDDRFILHQDGAIDFVFGGAGSDTLDLSARTSGVVVDLGANGLGTLANASGGQVDQLVSIENVIGGSGDDIFIASDAENRLEGGAGADIYRFGSADAADGDHIADFAPGDTIDLSAIDAMNDVDGHQAFVLAPQGAAPAAGMLVLSQTDDGLTLIEGFVDDDGEAEFSLTVNSTATLTAGDFTI